MGKNSIAPHLQPLFGLLFALQAQDNGLSTQWGYFQLVFFPFCLLLFVDNTAAQQTDIQQGSLIL